MKILVPIKRVVDPYVKVRIKPDGTGVDTQNIKMSMNPFDEIAVEEAIRLKEKGIATEILVVSFGPTQCQETLRQALAMGATQALLGQTEQELQPLAVAKLLAKLVQQEQANIVIMGKQAIDDDANQTGQMLAALLDWPQATFASEIKIENDHAEVRREVDGGLQTLRLELPCIITTDLRLNTPRFAKLPDIMKAKSKPLKIMPLEDFGIDYQARLKTLKVEAPAARKTGIRVESATALVEKLRHEAKVI